MGSYGRVTTPPEVRPLNLDRPVSAGSVYAQQPYSHHPNASGPSSIASGAPAPAAALQAAEAAARDRDRDDRTPSTNGPKRLREWEDEPPKQPADEKRQRLDDHVARPSSLPDRGSPARPHVNDVEVRHVEEQRRTNESYHPSEAAHHPSLPAIQQPTPTPQPQAIPRLSEAVKEERREPQHEPAARRMEVDENYDDDGEDEKRPLPPPIPPPKVERDSPKSVNPNVTPIEA